MESDLRRIKSIWNGECLINAKKKKVIKNYNPTNFEYEIQDIYKDDTGNIISINIKISNDFTLRLVNVYGPNKDDPEFF